MPYCVSSSPEDVFASYMRKGEWPAAENSFIQGRQRNANSFSPLTDPHRPVAEPQESTVVDPWIAEFFANLTNDDFSFVSRTAVCSPVPPAAPAQILLPPCAVQGAPEPRFDPAQASMFMNNTVALTSAAPALSTILSGATDTKETCLRMSPLQQSASNSRSVPYAAPASDPTLASVSYVNAGLESFLEGFPSIPCYPTLGVPSAERNHGPIEHAVTRQEPVMQSRRVMSVSAGFQENKRIRESEKDEDRRRRNREASSRAYYNRKKRVESLEDRLRAEKRKLTSLFARQLQLRKESAILKARLLDI
jgi:hypothetical protein